MTWGVDVVVPTSGRPVLGRLLLSLEAAGEPQPGRVIVVDDRRNPAGRLAVPATGLPVEVLTASDGRLVVVGQPDAPAHHHDRHALAGGAGAER